MICASLTMPAYLPALIRFGRQIEELSQPRPLFVCGGQVFADNPGLARQVSGFCLEGDLLDIVERLYGMVQVGSTDPH
jgi:hypothetical protein